MCLRFGAGSGCSRGSRRGRLERPVRAPAQRRRQAIRAVLIAIQPVRLLAGVAARRRMRLVAAHLHQMPPVLPAEHHLEAAVALAKDAGRPLPGAVTRHAISLDNLVFSCNHIFRAPSVHARKLLCRPRLGRDRRLVDAPDRARGDARIAPVRRLRQQGSAICPLSRAAELLRRFAGR